MHRKHIIICDITCVITCSPPHWHLMRRQCEAHRGIQHLSVVFCLQIRHKVFQLCQEGGHCESLSSFVLHLLTLCLPEVGGSWIRHIFLILFLLLPSSLRLSFNTLGLEALFQRSHCLILITMCGLWYML